MIITIAFLFLISGMNAQFTKIPDRNFEQALIDQKIDSDGVINQKVLTSDIYTLRSLIIPRKKIANLAGIEGFKSLIYLDISYNVGLDYLSLEGIPLLEELICNNSSLKDIYIGKNLNLKYLYCNNNKFTGLQILKNTLLEKLNCSNNPLRILDISNNKLLKQLYCQQNKLWDLDISNNKLLEQLFCQRNKLTELYLGNNSLLESLACQSNQLKKLEINLNTKLKLLFFNNNKISTIDTNENILLESLECPGNGLTKLNLKKNAKLSSLYCYDNDLIALDLSNNPLLKNIKIVNNNLSYLNLKNGNNKIIRFIRAKNNPELTCLLVDNPISFSKKWKSKFDAGVNFVDSKDKCMTTSVPDAGFETFLRLKGLDGTGPLNDGKVFTYKISTVKELEVSKMLKGIYVYTLNIRSLKGIEGFKQLRKLYCPWLRIKSLGLSKNLALNYLNIHKSKNLTSLNLSKNAALRVLYCWGNDNLRSLNLKNGNNRNLKNIFIFNPKLTCIDVDNPTSFSRRWKSVFDRGFVFKKDCSSSGKSRRSVDRGVSLTKTSTGKFSINIDVNPGEIIEKIDIYDSKHTMLYSSKNKKEYDIGNLRKSPFYIIKVTTNKEVLFKKVTFDK